jgi:peptidoglycan hydrolase-like protein with peptidoglycan-binding domain
MSEMASERATPARRPEDPEHDEDIEGGEGGGDLDGDAPVAQFQGFRLKLRNRTPGRYVLGVEVSVGFEDGKARVLEPDDEPFDEVDEVDETPMGATAHALAARAPAPAPAARKPAVRIRLSDAQPGKQNNAVLIVQKALAKAVGLDYSSGPGHFGPRTKAAYARWQRKCGASGPAVNGRPDLRTLKRLGDRYGFAVVRGPVTPARGRMPGATWRPIPTNFTRNGQQQVRGLVIHIMDGTLAGTDSWFRNPRAQASSHFGTSKGGTLYQWVSTKDRAWAQAAGNRTWLSVENEGRGGDALTPKQIERCAQILAWAHRAYGVPLQVANGPNGRGLGHHSMGGRSWGHPSCPGARIIKQKPAIVARAKQIVRARSATARGTGPRSVATPTHHFTHN